MSRVSSSKATLTVSALFASGLFMGAWTGTAAAERTRNPYAELSLFARVLTTIETDYVEEKSSEVLVHDAITHMVGDLDPHSRWLSKETYERFRQESHGNYVGIGIEVLPEEAGIRVLRVLTGGPAERDGLQDQDLILEVDGTSAADLDASRVEDLLQGTRGEAVRLRIRRGDAELGVDTVRDTVLTPSVEAHRLGDIGYLRLLQFQEGTDSEMRDALAQMPDITGLVVDVRDNPGGLLDQAVAVSDLFLDEGVIVSTRGRLEGEIVHRATPGGVAADLPVALLVNGGSASASEILAGALQDTERARLFGEPTYGKGSVQTLYELGDGSAIKLTIGRYYTPSGAPVESAQGRTPDEAVSLVPETDPAGELREALGALSLPEEEQQRLLGLVDQLESRETHSEIPWNVDWSERLEQDPQLAAAVAWLPG